VRDHSTAMICFVQKCNWLCRNVGCHINLRMQICNIKKLHLQANLCEVLEIRGKQRQNYCGDIVLVVGLAVFKNTVFNHYSAEDLNQNGEVSTYLHIGL